MCYYCGYQPYYQYYSPYQYPATTYSYPSYGYTFPYYGLPFGYTYTLPSPPVIYTVVPQFQRGEHRVGNCLMIC